MRVTLLGSGGSAGVPEVGCTCDVCLSDHPRNKRTRSSLFVEKDGKHFLIDTSPDLRLQALRGQIKHVDAVLYTHEHTDHTAGIDDLRAFNKISDLAIDIYGNNTTLEALKNRFGYAFLPKPEYAWYRPCLKPHILPDVPRHDFEVKGVPITAFEQQHGKVKTFGYRFDGFAYSTDTDVLAESAFEALEGVDVWMVDCLRYTQSYTHSHLENTLKWIARVKPKKAILIHMAHDFDYERLKAELPAGIIPGYDGITIEL